ncbi:MAG: adenylate/guanylate cyclase domain-containing protein, partial [Proteobacteria bacterium]|nr:adenylate/guanylate cyclase domain-containing protein [Pseudomonadota bacterium]
LFCMIIMTVITIWYEKPIRRCINLFGKDIPPDPALLDSARRRLLNIPYMVVAMDIFVWGFGSILFASIGSPAGASMGIACGLITVIIAFFWVEHMTQHKLVPLFFPDGGLFKVKGTKSINLKIRLSVLVFSVSIVPLAYIHLTIHQFKILQSTGTMTPLMLANRIQETIAAESLVFMVIGILISILVGHNLKKPVSEIIRAMRQVKNGDLNAKAIVYTNDEIGFAGEILNAMTKGLREREMIKDTFGRYVDSKIRDEILNGRIPLDGELKEATILFADLRNFTPLVEVTPPKELIHLLNDYLNAMAEAIKLHGGLILQFIGDEIEAVFGAPIHEKGHVISAVNAALEMRKQLEKINKIHAKEGHASLSHGIGIHTGQVLAANIGSSDRTAYSLIGDTVNTASRIQDLNKEFGTDILVSAEVAEHLGQEITLHPLPELVLKGKTKPVKVFSIA